jgi:DedD protein
MEARAKQRLTGAVILVALFVLLVPELLKGPRDSHPGQEANSDDGLHRYTIDLDAQSAPASTPGTATNPPAVSLPAVPTQEPGNSTLAAPGEAAAPEPPAASKAPVSPAGKPPANPGVATTPAPNKVVVATPAAMSGPSSRTEAARTTSEPPVSRATSGVSFAVQLGTFGKRENADRLARDMSAKGFAAFVVPTTTNGHELYRVRVGPTRDRESAEALAVQLKRVGQSGSVVPIS